MVVVRNTCRASLAIIPGAMTAIDEENNNSIQAGSCNVAFQPALPPVLYTTHTTDA